MVAVSGLGQNAASFVAVVNRTGNFALSVAKSDISHVWGHGGGPNGPQIPGCCVTTPLIDAGSITLFSGFDNVLPAIIAHVAPMECPATMMLPRSTRPYNNDLESPLACFANSIACNKNSPFVFVVSGFLSFFGDFMYGNTTIKPWEA